LTPPEATFLLLGGNGMCFVSVTPNSCAYHVTSDQPWIMIQGGGFGTGDATVSYQVQGLAISSRNGNLILQENPNERCHVTQAAFGRPEQGGGLPSSSELDVAGGALQLVWNGATVRYLREGASVGDAPVVAGLNRIEALLVTSAGRPGTWRFTAPTSVRPGSLRALAGAVAAVDSGSISFHLKGVPGERLVLVFETEP
jgi:hypothetical protein